MQPTDGSEARPYAATDADERSGHMSPDGRWMAYTSTASGPAEVYVDGYPRPGRRTKVSNGGGVDPVWRGDGRALYDWRDDALIAVNVELGRGRQAPAIGAETVLFRMPYQVGLNPMYDVSADGQRFVIVRRQ